MIEALLSWCAVVVHLAAVAATTAAAWWSKGRPQQERRAALALALYVATEWFVDRARGELLRRLPKPGPLPPAPEWWPIVHLESGLFMLAIFGPLALFVAAFLRTPAWPELSDWPDGAELLARLERRTLLAALGSVATAYGAVCLVVVSGYPGLRSEHLFRTFGVLHIAAFVAESAVFLWWLSARGRPLMTPERHGAVVLAILNVAVSFGPLRPDAPNRERFEPYAAAVYLVVYFVIACGVGIAVWARMKAARIIQPGGLSGGSSPSLS